MMGLLEIILQSTLGALRRLTRFFFCRLETITGQTGKMQENQNTGEQGVKLRRYQREGNVTDFNNRVPKGHIERRPG